MQSDYEDRIRQIEERVQKLFLQETTIGAEHLELAEQLVQSADNQIAEVLPGLQELPSEVAKDNEDIRNFLLKATLPQKIKLALLGNTTCRSLLVRDANKMIQQLVMKNPRLQSSEVEEFAKNPNLSEMVLRTIADNAHWMKGYGIKCSIVFNPKSPQAASLRWMKYLNVSDLRKLAKSKNVPNVITVAARKKLADMGPG